MIAWISSHHLHLQWKFKLLAGKFTWDNKAKHCWALSTNFKNQKFVDITQECFALLPEVNFPANNLNFHWRWRWWDWIQSSFLNLFYFTFLGEDQNEGPQATSNGEPKENGNKNGGDPNGSKSSDFKGHLNGLYNGLANIMTTTCDIGPDSRSQVAPFAVEKAVHNIMFIKHHMKRQDEFDAVSIFMYFFSNNKLMT